MDDIVDTSEMTTATIQTENADKPTLEEARNKILRYGDSELERLHKDWGKPKTPRVFTYKTENGQIDMVGTAHTQEVNSPMLQVITQEVGNYLNRTPQDKALVMIEGFHGGTIPEWSSLGEAVAASGEMGVTAQMAREKRVEVVSPEVETEEVVKKLKEQGISSDRIALFYSLRAMPSLIRQGKYDQLSRAIYHAQSVSQAEWVPPFTKDEEQRVISDPEEAKRKGAEVLKTCMPKLNEAMKEVNGQNVFDEETGKVLLSEDNLHELTSPRSGKVDTALNQISRIDNEARDDYLLEEIYKATEKGKNPLVVFGGTHALKVNPALQYLYS